MSSRPFVRQLGFQPGIQLNPIVEAIGGVGSEIPDQVFAAIARMTRGRIDRPIRVTQDNFYKKTGAMAPINDDAVNEVRVQVSEALANGSAGSVLMRIVPLGAAAKMYAAVTVGAAAAVSNLELWIYQIGDDLTYPATPSGLIDGTGQGQPGYIYMRRFDVVRDALGALVSSTPSADETMPVLDWIGTGTAPELVPPSLRYDDGVWALTPSADSLGIMLISTLAPSPLSLAINIADYYGYDQTSFEYTWAP